MRISDDFRGNRSSKLAQICLVLETKFSNECYSNFLLNLHNTLSNIIYIYIFFIISGKYKKMWHFHFNKMIYFICIFISVDWLLAVTDVTSEINLGVNGIIAGYGDFNSDQATDVFVITNSGRFSNFYVFLKETLICRNGSHYRQ